MSIDMDKLGRALRGEPEPRIPTWEAGIAVLAAKLPELLTTAAITINDARTIRHLVEHYNSGVEGEGDNDCNS